MKYISYDLGYKNLAFCMGSVSEAGECSIERWDCVDIVTDSNITKAKKPTIEKLVQCLLWHLRQVEATTADVDQVLIEIQPAGGFHRRSNTKMKCLSHCLQFYYLERNKTVKFVSPKLKLKGANFKHVKASKDRYALHKKFAIEKCAGIIKGTPWEQVFDQSKKKDDLADSYLQACATYNASY